MKRLGVEKRRKLLTFLYFSPLHGSAFPRHFKWAKLKMFAEKIKLSVCYVKRSELKRERFYENFISIAWRGRSWKSFCGREGKHSFLNQKVGFTRKEKKIKNLIGFFTLWILCNFCRYLHLFSSPVRFGVAKLKQKLAEPLSLSANKSVIAL